MDGPPPKRTRKRLAVRTFGDASTASSLPSQPIPALRAAPPQTFTLWDEDQYDGGEEDPEVMRALSLKNLRLVEEEEEHMEQEEDDGEEKEEEKKCEEVLPVASKDKPRPAQDSGDEKEGEEGDGEGEDEEENTPEKKRARLEGKFAARKAQHKAARSKATVALDVFERSLAGHHFRSERERWRREEEEAKEASPEEEEKRQAILEEDRRILGITTYKPVKLKESVRQRLERQWLEFSTARDQAINGLEGDDAARKERLLREEALRTAAADTLAHDSEGKAMLAAIDVVMADIEAEYQAAKAKQIIHTREQLSADRMRDQRHCLGDQRMEAIYKTLNSLGFTRSKHQCLFHDKFVRAALPLIYGKEWPMVRDRVLDDLGIDRIRAEVLIQTARRFGKTTSVAMFVVAQVDTKNTGIRVLRMLLHVPGIQIAIFSTGQRASSALMREIKRMLALVPGANERIVRQTEELLFLSTKARPEGLSVNGSATRDLANDSTVSKLYSFPQGTHEWIALYNPPILQPPNGIGDAHAMGVMPPELESFLPLTSAESAIHLPEDESLKVPDAVRDKKQHIMALLKDAWVFLMDRADGKGGRQKTDVFTSERREFVEQIWKQDFIRFNPVSGKKTFERSMTDWAFQAICASHVAERPQMHPLIDKGAMGVVYARTLEPDKYTLTDSEKEACRILPLTRIWDPFTAIAVYGCVHNQTVRSMWPDDTVMSGIRWDVALLVHCFFGTVQPVTHARIVALLEQYPFQATDLQDPALLVHFRACRIPKGLQDAIEARREKARLKKKAELEDVRFQMEAVRLAQEEMDSEEEEEFERRHNEIYFNPDIDGETAEELHGDVFRSSSEEVASSFVRKASRFFYQVDRDLEFLRTYHAEDSPPPPVFTEATLARLKEWIHTKYSAPEQAEELTELMRNLGMTHFLPFGTSTSASRDKLTVYRKQIPILDAKQELGVDLSSYLHDKLIKTQPLSQLLDDPDYYDALLFAQWEFQMIQRAGIPFIERYVCYNPHDEEWQKRFEAEVYNRDRRKRPILVWASKQWWLFYEQRLHRCSSMDNALLYWNLILERDFGEYTVHEAHNPICIRITLEDLTNILPCYLLLQPERVPSSPLPPVEPELEAVPMSLSLAPGFP